MTIWLALAYGVLQGITEFLPVSSSGHLVLFNKIFSVDGDFVFFSILLHLATLLAIIVILWDEIKFLIRKPFSKPALLLYIGTIPTIIIVLLFKNFVTDSFEGNFLPICFMITAVLLFVTEIFSKTNLNKEINYKKSLIIGISQGIAVLPGISRSGSTICTAILCGVPREKASKFSFLLSIPVILGSMCFEILEGVTGGVQFQLPILPSILAFLSAFLVGCLCLKFMLKIFQKIKLWWFSIYLVFISIISFFII